MSNISDRERERFRALLRQAATGDSRRLHPDPYERKHATGTDSSSRASGAAQTFAKRSRTTPKSR